MASSILLPLSLLLLLSPTALSAQTCKSHKFTTTNKSFTTCTDLPHLSAYLHYTYNSSTSTLSMAFTAPPTKSSGWVAWAINPTSLAMIGSQALVAFKSSNGSVSVSTYDLQSYSKIIQGPISYNVSDLAGETSGDTISLFATWKLPANTESINQVWQVGASVTAGRPDKHDFAPANLESKEKLDLTTVGSPSEAPAPNSGKNAAGEMTVGIMRNGVWLGLIMGVFVLFLF